MFVPLEDLLLVVECTCEAFTDLLLHLEPMVLVEIVFDLHVVHVILLVVAVKAVQPIEQALLLLLVRLPIDLLQLKALCLAQELLHELVIPVLASLQLVDD